MENILLEFKNVTGKSRKFSLANVSFSLPAGYIMGLMGVNGAGKTTLINYIMSEKILYKGSILIGGVDIRENHGYIKNFIGFVSEENIFINERSGKQNAEILGVFYEDFDMELFESAMKDMGVSTALVYGKMSRGEKMKFQMAFAMAHHPVIYLLDEVTAGMDPVFRLDFHKILHKVIEDEKASVLMTSHIESELEQKTDFVGILENGELIKFGESIDVIPEYKGDE